MWKLGVIGPEAPFLISEEKEAFLEDGSNFRCVKSCSGYVSSSPLIIKGGCVLQMPQLKYLRLGKMKMSLSWQHLVYWKKKTHSSLCAIASNLQSWVISVPQGQWEQALRQSLVPIINNEGLLAYTKNWWKWFWILSPSPAVKLLPLSRPHRYSWNGSAVSFLHLIRKNQCTEDRGGLLNVLKHFLIQGQSTADN